jgi:hypothetical protein
MYDHICGALLTFQVVGESPWLCIGATSLRLLPLTVLLWVLV